jgi:hypothetical protein
MQHRVIGPLYAAPSHGGGAALYLLEEGLDLVAVDDAVVVLVQSLPTMTVTSLEFLQTMVLLMI